MRVGIRFDSVLRIFRISMADDYYNVLNVSRTASQEEIQKSYRRLARKFHPDLHADEEEKEKQAAKQKFQKIQQAYDVLSDPEKRQMYDQLGPEFDRMGGKSPFGGAAPEFDFSQIFGGQGGRAGGFEDLLRQFGMGASGAGPMGGGPRGGPFQRPPGPAKGLDVEQQITVPFSTAVLGGEYRVTLERRSGKVETIDVKIPAGIESGKKIRLRGQGDPGFDGGPRGDLLIQVKISPHPTYSRKGLNLLVTLPVTVGEAVRGAKIDLPTPHGTITVTVPPGSSSGKSLRLKGMGIKGKELKGDLIATLQIVLPKNLSAKDIQLIEKLDACWNGASPRTELKW
jgi:DnaJ-class molecular chaperone